jgi:hypothetical protein
MTTARFEPATPLAAATVPEPSAPATASDVDEARAVEVVALHVAATALSASASLADREKVRSQWAAHLLVADACRHPEWHIVYLPGMTFNDGETWAVHRTTGRVAGGDCPLTGQHHNESTQAWLNRIG